MTGLAVTEADRERAALSITIQGPDGDKLRDWLEFQFSQVRHEARIAALEEAAKVAETLQIGGGTLSSWINTNESPMGATKRHIATAIRNLKGAGA